MESNDIAMIAISKCFEHFGIDQMPSKDEQIRWRHLVERCRLTLLKVDLIFSEIAAENESLKMEKIFSAFSRSAHVHSYIPKHDEFNQSNKRVCAYCRDSGYATTYHPRNRELLTTVLCFCDSGKILQTPPAPQKPSSARSAEEPNVRQAVMLFHQHETERLELWQKRHGLEMEDRDEFFRIFKLRFLAKLPQLFQPMKPTPVNTKNAQVGGLPASVNEHELAFAAYHNGDERGWE